MSVCVRVCEFYFLVLKLFYDFLQSVIYVLFEYIMEEKFELTGEKINMYVSPSKDNCLQLTKDYRTKSNIFA